MKSVTVQASASLKKPHRGIDVSLSSLLLFLSPLSLST